VNETVLTVTGNLVDRPELRITSGGAALCRFSIAATPRLFDAKSRTWKDADPLFLSCAAWRDLAENIAESNLGKGTRVVVTGRLRMSQWTTEAGDKRTGYSLEVDDIGASMRFARVSATKVGRSPAGQPAGPAAGSDDEEQAAF